jgi:hypothetical protein
VVAAPRIAAQTPKPRGHEQAAQQIGGRPSNGVGQP